MKFSKDLPTKPGWYWYKKYEGWSAIPVEVVEENGVLMYDGWSLQYHNGFWALLSECDDYSLLSF